MRGPLSDPKAQEEFARRRKARDERRATLFKELMRHEWGRELLYGFVFEDCQALSGIFDPSGQRFACNEGHREVGIALMKDAQRYCPELWAEAVKERILAQAQEAQAEERIVRESRTRSDT